MKSVWEKKYTVPEWGKLYKEYEKMCFSGKYDYKIDLYRLGITTPNDIEQVEIVFREDKMYSVDVLHKDKSVGYEGYTGQWYSYNDGGFGSFLWDKYGEEGEEKMAIKSSISTSMLKTGESAADFATAAEALKGYKYSTTDVAYSSTPSVTRIWTDHTDYVNYNSISNKTTIDTSIYAHVDDISLLKDKIDKLEIKINDKTDRENSKMKFNLDFGKLNNKSIGLSFKGPCVKNADGNWVVYDTESKEVIAVDGFTLEKSEEYLYKMPVALKDVKKGDMLLHNGLVVFVEEINTEEESKKVKSLVVVSPTDGEVKEILPIKNMFNFEYMTKIVNVFDMFAEKPSADNPFGNMLPFLMMKDGAKNFKDIVLMQALMNGKEQPSFSLSWASRVPALIVFLSELSSPSLPLGSFP